MTLQELFECGLIKDDDHIQINRPVAGQVQEIRAGNWFQDNILEWMDIPIYLFKWTRENGWFVTLVREVAR